jgi:colanic acid/amylovoran biosynthesis glycosyltransferase
MTMFFGTCQEEVMKIKKVAIYRECLLGYSETFIYSQTLHFNEFNAKFFGIYYVRNKIFGKIDSFILNKGGAIGTVREAIYKFFGYSPKMVKELKHYAPDIIHVHYGTDAARAIGLLRSLNRPIVVTFHGYDSNTTDEWKMTSGPILFKKYVKKRNELIANVHCFIAVSEFVKTKLIEQGYDESRIVVCPIGIDTSMFINNNMSPRKGNVLFVGRLCKNKGLEYLIKAMSIIQKTRPNVELTIVGNGEIRSEMEVMAGTLLTNYRFLGSIEHEQVKKLMSEASVFCVPSIEIQSGESESFGLVFAEAEALGTPVVSFTTGGIPEAVINNKTGFLCMPGDSDALAEKIEYLLANPDVWNAFSEAGKKHIRDNYSIVKTTAQLERIYLETITDYYFQTEQGNSKI